MLSYYDCGTGNVIRVSDTFLQALPLEGSYPSHYKVPLEGFVSRELFNQFCPRNGVVVHLSKAVNAVRYDSNDLALDHSRIIDEWVKRSTIITNSLLVPLSNNAFFLAIPKLQG